MYGAAVECKTVCAMVVYDQEQMESIGSMYVFDNSCCELSSLLLYPTTGDTDVKVMSTGDTDVKVLSKTNGLLRHRPNVGWNSTSSLQN